MVDIEKLVIPSLEEVPEYAALAAKGREIEAERRKVQGEIDRLHEALASGAEPVSARAREVAGILGDEIPSDAIDRTKLPELYRRADALRLAADEMKRRLSEARMKASREICTRIAPAYAELVRNVCHKLIAAHAAAVEYRKLAGALNDADVAWSGLLRPMHPGLLGDLGPLGLVALYLREAAEYGLFPENEIPDELAWPPRQQPAEARRARVRDMRDQLSAKARTIVKGRSAPANELAGIRVAS